MVDAKDLEIEFRKHEKVFTKISATLLKKPKVSQPIRKKGFGSSALWVNGKIFALLSSEKEFVVKLPRERVDNLVAAGDGERFDPRRNGKVMKEWFVAKFVPESEWMGLAKEAMEFVLSR